MGSVFKTSTPAPTPPAPPSTIRDEINGVEQVPVTNADGSVTYVTRSLPLTAEQQAQRDQLNAIMAESLAEIQKLSAADYAPDEDTQRILAQWQTAQKQLLSEQTAKRSSGEEETLARRGLSDSTAAQAVRRQRVLDEQKSEQAIALQADEMASQVRAERLGLQQSLYNLAAGQTDANAARVAQAAARAQSNGLALSAQRQASILDYYNRQDGNALFGTALSSSLGGGIGRSVGTSVSGLLGSLFARG